MYAWHPRKSEKGIRCPGTGVKNGYEPPCGCWKSNLGSSVRAVNALNGEPSTQSPKNMILKTDYWYKDKHTQSRCQQLEDTKDQNENDMYSDHQDLWPAKVFKDRFTRDMIQIRQER